MRRETPERFAARSAPHPSVVHLAAYYDVSGEPNQIRVQGTRRLIEAFQGFDVEQLIFASTMLVHRPTRARHLAAAEGSVCQIANAYRRASWASSSNRPEAPWWPPLVSV